MSKTFSEEEDQVIKSMVEKGHISKVIAKKLCRDKKEVRNRIHDLGLAPIPPLLKNLKEKPGSP